MISALFRTYSGGRRSRLGIITSFNSSILSCLSIPRLGWMHLFPIKMRTNAVAKLNWQLSFLLSRGNCTIIWYIDDDHDALKIRRSFTQIAMYILMHMRKSKMEGLSE